MSKAQGKFDFSAHHPFKKTTANNRIVLVVYPNQQKANAPEQARI